jgi:hypothetical protein
MGHDLRKNKDRIPEKYAPAVLKVLSAAVATLVPKPFVVGQTATKTAAVDNSEIRHAESA